MKYGILVRTIPIGASRARAASCLVRGRERAGFDFHDAVRGLRLVAEIHAARLARGLVDFSVEARAVVLP